MFLTPDQKPFYGGTYFPPAGWKELLTNIHTAFVQNRNQLEESAQKFAISLNRDPLDQFLSQSSQFSPEAFSTLNQNLANGFDGKEGGMGSAPKFPMPSIWSYVIQYLQHDSYDSLSNQLHLTLEKMALGGIYDQVGGGFARYSTDGHWFAPHFEKMLYDNGQLLSIYSEAYKLKPNLLYREVVEQTVDWLDREMTGEQGAFYSALDADSEGVEGKFYVWTDDELKEVLKEDYDWVSNHYNTTQEGNWEKGWNILFRNRNDKELKNNDLTSKIKSINSILLKARSRRIRPGLDHKVLTSWNALMSTGLLKSHAAFGNTCFLNLALKNIDFMLADLVNDTVVYHSHGKTIVGFMDDYALLIETLIEAYQSTFNDKYLAKAQALTEYCMSEFYDERKNFFFYTSRSGEQLIADKKELYDNVIPASNSIMCINLLKLGVMLENENYKQTAEAMLSAIQALIVKEPRFMSNWAKALHLQVYPPYEVIIVGDQAEELRDELANKSLPNHLIMGAKSDSKLPLLEGRAAIDGQTTIYVCRNKTCQLPVYSVSDAVKQMSN